MRMHTRLHRCPRRMICPRTVAIAEVSAGKGMGQAEVMTPNSPTSMISTIVFIYHAKGGHGKLHLKIFWKKNITVVVGSFFRMLGKRFQESPERQLRWSDCLRE